MNSNWKVAIAACIGAVVGFGIASMVRGGPSAGTLRNERGSDKAGAQAALRGRLLRCGRIQPAQRRSGGGAPADVGSDAETSHGTDASGDGDFPVAVHD